MTRPGLFLCGCDPENPRIKHYSFHPDSNGGGTFKRFNDQGQEVCPWHGVPLYGFLTPLVTGPQGNRIIDYSKAGSKRPLKLKPTESIDRRDTRDPLEVGRTLLHGSFTDLDSHSLHEIADKFERGELTLPHQAQ